MTAANGIALGEIARHVGGTLHGDASRVITGVATLQSAGPTDITFLANPRYRKYLASTQAGAVILAANDLNECATAAVVTANPYAAYARATMLLYADRALPEPGIHASACVSADSRVHDSASIGAHCVIEAGAEIAAHVSIGPGCFIGKEAVIGEGSRISPNVTICHGARIGRRVLIHPGAVIGSDGFGLASDHGVWVKVLQLGGVSIGDDVEIGANTTIDRGALEDTVIEDGVKLDNQIQIAHNVRIGAHTAIAGCVGIAGSAHIGRRCTIGGGVGISGHLEIADDVHITGMSFVTKSIRQPGLYSSGIPADTNQQWHKNTVRFRQLDDMARRLKALEERLKREQENSEK
ncbi:MAG: UDP-3-O-(3-hydroxymyristoyl)glucosamine N-acyltransferase [Pseudomonadota bacterium]